MQSFSVGGPSRPDPRFHPPSRGGLGIAGSRRSSAAARTAAALVLVLLAAFAFVAATTSRATRGIDAPSSVSSSSNPNSSFRSDVSTRSASTSADGSEDEKSKKSGSGADKATEDERASSTSSGATRPGAPPLPSVHFARPLRELRHDGSAFTQGLEYDRVCAGPNAREGGGCRDVFWESTGLNGKSTVRLVDLETGKVLRSAKLPDDAFGEGLTRVFGVAAAKGDGSSPLSSSPRLLQLTWLSGRAFWHDAASLWNSTAGERGENPVEALGAAIGDALGRRSPPPPPSTERRPTRPPTVETKTALRDGWGAAFVPQASAVALSDGSSRITFADASDVGRELRSIVVTDEDGSDKSDGASDASKPKRVEVFNLNELEWVPASAVASLLRSPPSANASGAEKAPPSPPSPLGRGRQKASTEASVASLSPTDDGEIWANVWGTPCVARVDPSSGDVLGWILAPDLRQKAVAAASGSSFGARAQQGPVDVMNGVAVDDGGRGNGEGETSTSPSSEPRLPRRARLFLGGKNWPLFFEVKLERAGGGGGASGDAGASASSSSQQLASLTAARGSCIKPPADFGR